MRDIDIRVPLRERLRPQDDTTRLVEEMGVYNGTVRVDMAIIGDDLHGFELKSEKDNLKRLPAQASVYNRVFDRVTLVVAHKHAAHALLLIPNWWGVTIASMVDGELRLVEVRPARQNPSPDPKMIVKLLWREEIIAALDARDLAKGWRGKRVGALQKRLIENVSLDELRAVVRETLLRRENWLAR